MDSMQYGVLWFDANLKLDLQAVADRAAHYVLGKYGCMPTICFVHPGVLSQKTRLKNGLEIRPSRYVLPNHLWLEISPDAQLPLKAQPN